MSQPEDYYIDPQRRPLLGLNELKPKPETPIAEPEKEPWLKSFKTDLAQRSWAVNAPIATTNALDTISELTQQGMASDFNAVQDKYLNLVEPQYRHLLATSATEPELFRRVAMVQRESENRKILENAPITSIFASGAIDMASSPWNWLPTTWGLRSIKFGTGFAKSALQGGASFAASEIVNESILQSSQLTRSTAESLLNIGLAGVMGGLVGGVGGLIRTAELPLYKAMITESLDGKISKFQLNRNFEIEGLNVYSDSAGAMKAQFVDMKGSRLLGWGKEGKLRPARPLIWALGKYARNPVMVGLSSKSPTVVWFVGKTYEHNMDVVKNAVMGQNLAQSLQLNMRKWEAKGIIASLRINHLFAEYLGLDPTQPIKNIAKRKLGQFEGKLSFKDFQRQIMIGMVGDGTELTDPIMKRGAKELYSEFYEPVTKDLIELGILAPDIEPKMAIQYINRIYDQAYLIGNPAKATDFLHSKYTETNEKVIEARTKELYLQNEIEQLDGLINESVNKDAAQSFIEQRNTLKQELKIVGDELQERVIQGEFSPDMVTGEYKMKPQQINALRKLNQPLEDIEKKIAATDDVDLIKKLKQQKADYQAKLTKDMESGVIDESLWYKTQVGEFKLKPIDYGTIRLRPVMDDTGIRTAANDTYNTLTKQTEEQILQTLLDNSKMGSGGENPFMPRSLMISDVDLYKNFFLSSDFASTARTFNLRMGRLIEMHKMLKDKGWRPEMGSPLSWLAYKVEQDYSAFKSQLLSKQAKELEGIAGKELEKFELKHQAENIKLNKDMQRDLKITRVTYQRITGTVPKTNKELLDMARIANNYAYSTQLGALALLQTQDLVSPIFNAGVSNWIKGGVLPFVDMVTIASKKHRVAVSNWMRDLTVGIETEVALYGLANDVRDSVNFSTGWVDSFTAKAATAMGLINLSNAYGSLTSKIAANTSMYTNMRRLAKLIKGNIGKSDGIALGRLGLRDERIATVIWDQFQKHGEKIRGSYIPGWEKWGSTETDPAYQKLVAEVKDTFMNAIKQDIRSTIFTGNNIASYPLELDPNGLNKAFMTYMGWIFNASANYTVPLLQRYDQNRVNGALAMYFAACTVEPLRDLIKGKEPDLEPAMVFKKGILNSGILGLPLSLFNTANSMGRVFNDLQASRYKHRDRGLTFSGGAPMALAEGILNVAGQFANNDWNQKELEQLGRLVPIAQAMEFRKLMNDAIQSTGIKEKPERGKD